MKPSLPAPAIDAFRAKQLVSVLAKGPPRLDPSRGDAILALLAYYFTTISPEDSAVLANDPHAFKLVQTALRLVPLLDPPKRERFFFDIVLNAQQDPDLRLLASALAHAFDDRALEALFTRALTAKNPLHQRNLLAAFDYLTWHDDTRVTSPALRQKLRTLAGEHTRSRETSLAGVARSVRF